MCRREPAAVGCSEGVRKTLPLILFILFCLCTSVSKSLFAAWNCVDVELSTTHGGDGVPVVAVAQFLRDDLTIMCDGSSGEYQRILIAAIILVFIWPIGVPLLYLVVLVPIRRPIMEKRVTSSTRATQFLHKEYEPTLFFWESIFVFERLVVVGFVQWITSSELLRLQAGLLTTLGYLTLLLFLRPYKRHDLDILAIGAQLLLLGFFFAALNIKLHAELTDAEQGGASYTNLARSITGFSSATDLAGLIFALNLANLFLFSATTVYQMATTTPVRTLRLVTTRQPPDLTLESPLRFHLFLSHTWSSGQDQVAVIKRQLQLLLPGVQIFLDVDDLEEIGRLEDYVDASHAILCFLSRGYFFSANCLRELDEARRLSKQLILVHEANPQRGGVGLDVLRTDCDAKGRDAAELFDGRPVIPWLRIAEFQLHTLRLIAEEIVRTLPNLRQMRKMNDRLSCCGAGEQSALKSPRASVRLSVGDGGGVSSGMAGGAGTAGGSAEASSALGGSWGMLYMPGDLAEARLDFGAEVVLYVSPNNPGAQRLSDELVARYGDARRRLRIVSDARSVVTSGSGRFAFGTGRFTDLFASARDPPSEPATDRAEAVRPTTLAAASRQHTFRERSAGAAQSIGRALTRARWGGGSPEATHMLLYLNESTFVGEAGTMLAQEVRLARMRHRPLVAVHECDPALGGCVFEHLFQSTPQDLINTGLYKRIAVPLEAGSHRQISLALVAKELGAATVRRSSSMQMASIRRLSQVQRSLQDESPPSPRGASAASPTVEKLSTFRRTTKRVVGTRLALRGAKPGVTSTTSSSSTITATAHADAFQDVAKAVSMTSSDEQGKMHGLQTQLSLVQEGEEDVDADADDGSRSVRQSSSSFVGQRLSIGDLGRALSDVDVVIDAPGTPRGDASLRQTMAASDGASLA